MSHKTDSHTHHTQKNILLFTVINITLSGSCSFIHIILIYVNIMKDHVRSNSSRKQKNEMYM